MVPPRGAGVSSRKLAYDFFQGEILHIAEDGHRRPARGAHEAGGMPRGVGRAPTLEARVWAPSGTFFAQYFLLIPKKLSWSFRTFGVVQNRSLIFAPFPA